MISTSVSLFANSRCKSSEYSEVDPCVGYMRPPPHDRSDFRHIQVLNSWLARTKSVPCWPASFNIRANFKTRSERSTDAGKRRVNSKTRGRCACFELGVCTQVPGIVGIAQKPALLLLHSAPTSASPPNRTCHSKLHGIDFHQRGKKVQQYSAPRLYLAAPQALRYPKIGYMLGTHKSRLLGAQLKNDEQIPNRRLDCPHDLQNGQP
jgi:hypothetical protein